MSTRQATPGPSNVSALNTISINSRKRGVSFSEGLSDSVRKPKKSKGDDPKDKKKRRRKKRKISVTATPMLSLSSSRSRSKSRTMTAEPPTPINDPTESHSTLSLAAILDQEEEKVRLLEEDEVSEASSSKVDKGKGKAKEELSSALDNNSAHEVEIERLKKEIEAQQLLLQRHQSHLNQIQQSLSCEICLDLMHRPFALAPCGHVACHTCLVAWFTRDDEQTAGFPQRQNHFNRKKTCPVCRALVIQRPAEVWGLKSMVSNFQRSGLIEPSTHPFALPNASPDSANPPANNSGENNDPWQNIFRSARSERDRDPYHPLSPINHQGGMEDLGIYDEEDGGVYRCIDCINEIVGNRCTGCLRIYPGHPPEDEDEDDFDDEDEDLDIRGDNPVLQNLLNALANGEPIEDDYDDYESEADNEILEYFTGGHHSGSEDEYEDAEEEEVGGHGGFGFDMGVGGMGYPLTGGPIHQLGPQWIDEDSEEEDEPSAYIEEVHGGEDDEHEEGHFEPSFINDEEEDEEDDDSDGSSIYASPVNTGYRRRPETVVLSDDDEEDDEEDEEVQFLGSGRRAGSRYQRTTNSGGAVIISSDEED